MTQIRSVLSNPDDRFRIILNVLNHGTKKAVEWLWENFSEKEIIELLTTVLRQSGIESPLIFGR